MGRAEGDGSEVIARMHETAADDDEKYLTADGRWNGMTFAEYRAKSREVMATNRRVEDALRDQVRRLEGQSLSYFDQITAFHEAVASVRARYPEDVFPADGDTRDAASARFARLLCDEIVRIATDAEHG